jgi:formylglycine-generating enzyme required for sulfatase activity
MGSEEGMNRVVRGGSFGFPPVLVRSAMRVQNVPVHRSQVIGLRLVRR